MRGGERPGAGRPKRSVNRATAERETRIRESGPVPLDVMIEAMRWHHDRAKAEFAKGAEMDANIVRDEYALASEHAVRAAPYVHPRFASIQQTPTDYNFDCLTDNELRHLERLLSKAAAAPNDADPTQH